MLHLAQVHHNASLNRLELQLLAYQEALGNWVVRDSELIPVSEEIAQDMKEGMLVLATIDDCSQNITIENATDWVVNLLQEHFTLKQEEENWRRDLTLQSQDLTRRNLEIETRTEQIQQLEEKLKQEKEDWENNSD